MALRTVEELKQREAALKDKLARQGGSLDAPKLRTLKKKIRRTQRRRRTLVALAERHASRSSKPAEAKAEPAAEGKQAEGNKEE